MNDNSYDKKNVRRIKRTGKKPVSFCIWILAGDYKTDNYFRTYKPNKRTNVLFNKELFSCESDFEVFLYLTDITRRGLFDIKQILRPIIWIMTSKSIFV